MEIDNSDSSDLDLLVDNEFQEKQKKVKPVDKLFDESSEDEAPKEASKTLKLFEIPGKSTGNDRAADLEFIKYVFGCEDKLLETRAELREARRNFVSVLREILVKENRFIAAHNSKRLQKTKQRTQTKHAETKSEPQRNKSVTPPANSGTHLVAATGCNNPADSQDVSTETFSRLRIKNRAISQLYVDQKLKQLNYIRLNDIEGRIRGDTIPGSWVTIGIVGKVEVKAGGAGAFTQVKLTDLDENSRVLIAGKEIHETMKKTPLGTVVALCCPRVLKPTEKNKNLAALAIDDQDKVLVIGEAMDAARCKGINKASSRPCDVVVDARGCGHCKFHVGALNKKLKANRTHMALASQPIGRPPQKAAEGVYYFNNQLINTALNEVQQQPKKPGGTMMTKGDQKIYETYLGNGTMGVRYAKLMQGDKDIYAKDEIKAMNFDKMEPVHISSKQEFRQLFVQDHPGNPKPQNPAPKKKEIEFSSDEDEDANPNVNESISRVIELKRKNNIQFQPHDPNKVCNKKVKMTKEAVEELKKNASVELAKPRFKSIEKDIPMEESSKRSERVRLLAKKFNLDLKSEEFKRLVAAKSLFAKQLEAIQLTEIMDLLKREEFQEMVDEKRASITTLKVKGYYCATCKKYSQANLTHCMEKGHSVEKKDITKRQYQCGGCGEKNFFLGNSLPKASCRKCGNVGWLPVGAITAKPKQDTPEFAKVLPRGEEHGKFLD